MIEMKLIPDKTNPSQNILELTIKAPESPEPTPTPDTKIPTLIYIDDSIEDDQLPLITHALTDTVTRVTWPGQIQLLTSRIQLPNHLETLELQNGDMFKEAENKAPCTLILITNNESKDLKRQIAKSSEFLTNAHTLQPTTTIELVDTLNDHIKQLKQKTIVNIKIEIELPSEADTIEPLDYIPKIIKDGNKYFANLIDLASEEEKAYAFNISSNGARLKFDYEDLLLMRTVQGGITTHLA